MFAVLNSFIYTKFLIKVAKYLKSLLRILREKLADLVKHGSDLQIRGP